MSSVNQEKIKNWTSSGGYNTDVSQVLTKIMKESLFSNSEASTSSIFETNLYFLLRTKTGIELSFIKEKNVDGDPNEQHKFRGRLDAVVNNLIIEYKHCNKLKNSRQQKNAVSQVKKYLNSLKETEGVEYSAILTDGLKICYFDFREGVVENTTIASLTTKDLDSIIKAILNNSTKKFVPKNILNDFFINPRTLSISKSVAQNLYNKITNNPTEKTLMLFEEWQSLMHLSVDDKGKSDLTPKL